MKQIENEYLKIKQTADGYIRIFHKNGGVMIIAQTAEQRFVLIRTKRPGVAAGLEFPRGFKEQGETALTSAKRELQEETGIRYAKDWEQIGSFYPDNGIANGIVDILLCRVELEQESIIPQVEENIEKIEILTEPEIWQAIRQGDITDGISLAAFLQYRARAMETGVN